MQIPSSEVACYSLLIELLHPAGLACPRCHAQDRLGVHRRHREPVLDYQCEHCGRVFNAWTGTPLEKTHRRPSQLLQILVGIAVGTSTAELARRLRCQRAQLLALRRRLLPLARILCGHPRPSPSVDGANRTAATPDPANQAGSASRRRDPGSLLAVSALPALPSTHGGTCEVVRPPHFFLHQPATLARPLPLL